MRIADSLPLISVIMPVYNGERFLAGALHNVFAQNYHPLEVIVVDDGSTDGSAAIAATFGEQIRYLYQPNAGPAVARNTGLALARGEFIAFLDVDDLWPPGKLHFQMQYLQQNPALQLIWGYTQTVRLPCPSQRDLEPQTLFPPSLLPLVGSTLFHKAMLTAVAPFDPLLRMSEDVDWFMRIREAQVSLQVISAVTLIYRLHETNMTQGKKLVEMRTLQAIKQSLDRRRRQNSGIAAALPPLLTEATPS